MTTRMRIAAAGGIAAAAVVLASCAGGTTSTTGSSTPGSTTPGPTTATSPAPATQSVPQDQAQSLCTDLEAQLSNWRVQGPTVGRGGLNILVQTWAARYGLTVQVVQNRPLVDAATIDTCADTRSEVLDLLDIPDLASGLVGL